MSYANTTNCDEFPGGLLVVVFGRRRCDGWRCDTMRCDARGAFAKQCRSSLPFLGMLAPQRHGTGANCAEWRREVPEICLLDSFGARWFYPFVHMSVGKKSRKVSCTSIMYLLYSLFSSWPGSRGRCPQLEQAHNFKNVPFING